VKVAHQCREKRADPVMDKETANFCEYFEMRRGEWKGKAANSREDKARDDLRKLLGD
jgi:hypothetical protein